MKTKYLINKLINILNDKKQICISLLIFIYKKQSWYIQRILLPNLYGRLMWEIIIILYFELKTYIINLNFKNKFNIIYYLKKE